MSKRKTLHVVSLPHTEVSPQFVGCAYTSKVLKFCKMMSSLYDIFVYAPEGPEIPGATLVPCLHRADRIRIFGADDPARLPSWPTDEQTARFNENVIARLRVHLSDPKTSLILLTGGATHAAIANAFPFPAYITCEPGVGYGGIITGRCAFESYAWMHTVYAQKGIHDGRWFDTVIPNYFDPSEFNRLNKGNGKYLLFLGRIVKRKGPDIASEIAKACGLPLIVAGAGGKQVGKDIVSQEVTIRDADYVGPVNVKERAKLLAGAKALLVPTTYVEPFGGVAVEAMFAGTPAITTDWGAFPETVRVWRGGFRFRTLGEAKIAVDYCSDLEPAKIRKYAMDHYSLKAVAPQFDRWFKQLFSLWDKGWYN